MTYELLIGLNVTDESTYQQYRKAMRPILEGYGGGFRYDFRVSEVLQSASVHVINRVFTIYFPDENARTAFFSDEAYQAVRKQYFDNAVEGSTIIATYHTGKQG